MASIRTLLVDDHALFVETLAVRLSREPDIEVLPAALDPHDALRLVRTLAPTVLVLDLILGQMSGMVVLDEIQLIRPECHVVVLTGLSAADEVVEAFRRGAKAWLPKTVDGAHLVRVIRGVCRGECWMPPDVLGQVLRKLIAARPAVQDVRAEPAGQADPLRVLTARERDVLQGAVDGLSRIDIARRLFLSPNTVRTHAQNMLTKLSAHSMLEAVSVARRYGMRPGIG